MRINLFTQRNGLHLDNLRGAFKANRTDSKTERLILKPFLAMKDIVYLVMRPFTKEKQPTVKQQVTKISKSIASGVKKTAEVSKVKLSRGAKSAKDFIKKNQLIFIELTTITAIALGLIYRLNKKPGVKKLLPEKKVSQNPSDLRIVAVATIVMIFAGFTSSLLDKPSVEKGAPPVKKRAPPVKKRAPPVKKRAPPVKKGASSLFTKSFTRVKSKLNKKK